MYGFTIFSQNVFSYIILGAGIALLIIFIKIEMKTERPVIEIRLFRSVNFLLSNLAALFNYGATFAVGYLLSIYLQMVKGYNADISGLILIAQPAMQAILSPIAGRLSDKRSPYKLASFGMALCAASLLSYVFMDADAPLWHILLNLTVVGIGFGFFSSPNTNAIMSGVSPQDYGVASSLLSTMRSMGQIASMAIITIIMNIRLRNTPIDMADKDSIVASMHNAFIVFAGICTVGVFISLNRKSDKTKSDA
jgi:predicted MFS family arabinose efflux permease